ncbi:PH domain-containing protein [Novosphingobium album (ex Liu et al. 2023)]|uniref:PH domain-containing protein n=1 Tax=Novosphingobium album (ex Liu et al. 2023) TaxID=3031130 RepID=A0ABT5WXD0_9SPHN|nr:PH domain-containing protein [Novosphingobium album (ex Liu et al. 2023)]MDE8654564.1 PH domain-containing protein [Novosphingobium album (ex Liu et al. 2023)]
MAAAGHAFMGKVFVGVPVPIGALRDKYEAVLMDGEAVAIEFKSLRDGMILTDRRLVVFNTQGPTGRRVEVSSFPWASITAFSVEHSDAVDLDATIRICGAGWGVCEVQLARGMDARAVAQFMNGKILA